MREIKSCLENGKLVGVRQRLTPHDPEQISCFARSRAGRLNGCHFTGTAGGLFGERFGEVERLAFGEREGAPRRWDRSEEVRCVPPRAGHAR